MLRNILILSAMIMGLVFWGSSGGFVYSPDAGRPADPEQPTQAPDLVATAELPKGKVVKLVGDDRGHFSGQFRLNGRKVDAIVDTGATTVVINTATARRVGITLKPRDFNIEVMTANGKGRGARVKLESVEIGKIRIRDVDALVMPESVLPGTLVGMTFMNRLSRFESRDGALLLYE